jgi:hypothetical protein
MLCLPSILFPPINGRGEQTPVVMCVSFHMVLEHTGLRRCIEAVRFLTPICDPFFGIAVAIEHFVEINWEGTVGHHLQLPWSR